MSIEIATKDDLKELFNAHNQKFQEFSSNLLQELNSKFIERADNNSDDDIILWRRDIIARLGISPRTFTEVIIKLPFINQSQTLKKNQWYCRKSDLDKYISENTSI